EISVVVPLYKRIDFVEHQLAQFAHDPDFQNVDLVYVLDSPELEKEITNIGSQLFRLYRVPFRILFLERTSGFAAANRVGIDATVGDLLLLMNSDVLPVRPGWLESMASFYRYTDDIGALGVKLLHEDASLQHAGMFFHLPTDTALAGLWRNVHYFK